MSSSTRIYIIGAGFAGRGICEDIRRKEMLGEVVAFLDDDPEKIGTKIDGIPVLGPISDVVNLIKKTPADEALIAIPSAGRELLRILYERLKEADFERIRILPGISQIVDGDAHFIQTREIDPQDLLGRTPVHINLRESLSYLRGRRVLLTGAGGSIGSELARQLLSGGAERLYLLGHGENSIYEIDSELRLLQEEGVGEQATIVPIVGELKDREYTRFILNRLKADVVFHTAAYKHVPMMEANPVAAVENNVFGTLHLLQAAREAGTNRFVMISTDKVVEPLSIYGATKQIAERLVLSYADREFNCMVVRFGNVLGSRGSIIPLFRKQILKGGPVTVTDSRAERFFMTIPEAASLVLKTGGMGDSGELYTLDMGEPVKIRELAEQMVRFYGFEPEEQIAFREIGLRRGEKLTERLYNPGEHPEPTEHPRVHRVAFDDWEGYCAPLSDLLEELRPICIRTSGREASYRNRHHLKRALRTVVPSLPVDESEPTY
ncbi:MAG: polysaccharide biosynthesis protein [Alkalispirochaetaceae bacterium]